MFTFSNIGIFVAIAKLDSFVDTCRGTRWDRSTEAAPRDYGFGLVLDRAGRPSFGEAIVTRVHQEHGEARGAEPLPFARLPVGARVRVAPNHACLTAAAHDRYHVVDGGERVLAVWERVNGW